MTGGTILAGPVIGPLLHAPCGGGEQALDLDVPPADAPDAEPEDLADGLLRRPAAGERLGAAPDVAGLGRGEDAPGEPVAAGAATPG